MDGSDSIDFCTVDIASRYPQIDPEVAQRFTVLRGRMAIMVEGVLNVAEEGGTMRPPLEQPERGQQEHDRQRRRCSTEPRGPERIVEIARLQLLRLALQVGDHVGAEGVENGRIGAHW